MGRVKDGAMPVETPGFSDGSLFTDFTDADLEEMHDKGYIFFKSHPGKSGYYFNDSHVAAPLDDDYNYIEMGRVADKATRIANRVYIDEILDNVDVDADTGKLPVSTCKNFEQLIEQAIDTEMVGEGELSGVDAFCDADQNILQASEIDIELNLVPKGTSRKIVVNQQYALSLS
jgi:hypothetical protein